MDDGEAVRGMGGTSGGAAMGSGAEFQARIAAWATVHLLAEADAQPPLGLTSPVSSVGCEGADPVDDVLIRTVSGHSAYLQVKRTLSLSRSRRTENGRLTPLASTIDQFVRQFLAWREQASADATAAVDAAHDGLVLAVGARAPGSIRQTLKGVLDRLRLQPEDEPLASPTLNKAEREALDIVTRLARESWCEATGTGPTDQELHQLLRLVHVHTMEVEEGEAAERDAKTLLRMSVLEDPDQADQAWTQLVGIGHRLIRMRARIDRPALVTELAAAGIRLCTPRSYRPDVQRLRHHSAAITARLADYASIPLGAARVEISRPYVQALRAAAEEGPVLLVGEPGAGKSGVMYGLAQALSEDGRDVVVLAGQEPPFARLGELRDEFRLEHEISDVLANWPGAEPAFLLIDALDAARTDPGARALRQLMREVGERAPRWRAVASIREYDVRYGKDVQRLFRGEPPAGPGPALPGCEFARVRHIVVGRLREDELAQLEANAPRLHGLVYSAPPAVAELLHNPFNLRLAAELLDAGTDPAEIRGLKGQLDLLDLYWDQRVLLVGEVREAGARETVLRTAVRAMVEQRSLRVDRDLVEAEPSAAPALADLLSAHLLDEWSPGPGQAPRRSSLTFAHHVLFDYAVARLLLRRSSGRLVKLLESDHALVVLARPSLDMHFHYLWDLDSEGGDHAEFWETVLAITGAAGIPEIGKLIGPRVAAHRAREIDEFGSLLSTLAATDEPTRVAAATGFNHVVRSVIGQQGSLGEGADLWCALVERVSESFADGTAYAARALLSDLVERAEDLPPEQREKVGKASRRLLEFAWRRPQRDRWLVTHAIQYVCRTFSTEPVASAALLRRAIEAAHLAAHGSEELPWIAEAVPSLAPRDPELVRDIYAAAFAYRETSDAPAPMGGIVMRLVWNRRQDYEGALYMLARAYSGFLEVAPDQAISAMNAALECHVAREETPATEEPMQFELGGRNAQLLPDYSHIWDRGQAYPNEDAVKLLDDVEDRLSRLAGPDGDHDQLQHLLVQLSSRSRLAVVWRRLLRLGARHPETMGLELRELAWSVPILTCVDTSASAGEMIRAVAPHLPEAERERIERTILSIPEAVPEERRKGAERTRDRLLGCLPGSGLVTPEARARFEALQAEGALPSNDDEHRFNQFTSRPFGEVEYLAEEGVPVGEEANRRIRELEEPVKEFASAYLNAAPDEAAVVAILPQLRALHQALRSAESEGVHPEQSTYAWGTLAEASAAAAQLRELSCVSEAGVFVRKVLLEASEHEIPRPDAEADAKFVDPHWGKPAPRIDAAAGLPALAFDASCADDDVGAAIDRLSGDPSPAVRYQVAVRLLRLYGHSPDRCWRLIERMASADRSPGVLQGLVQSTLSGLRFEHPERIAVLVIDSYERSAAWPDAEKLRNACIDVLAGLFLAGKHNGASEIILNLADRPLEHLEQAGHLAHHFREILTHGPPDGSEPNADAARARAIDFVLRVTRSAADAFGRGIARETDDGAPAERPDENQLKQLAHLLDAVGWNLYFVSGAHADAETAGPGEQVQARLLREAGPIIDILAEVGLPSLTHHLLQTLEVLIPFEPRGVFGRVASAIRGGRKGGYQYDRMAEDVLVRIVERYLAEHREIFQKDEEARRTLIEILDTFVQAGSVGARRLSYGLDGVFR